MLRGRDGRRGASFSMVILGRRRVLVLARVQQLDGKAMQNLLTSPVLDSRLIPKVWPQWLNIRCNWTG